MNNSYLERFSKLNLNDNSYNLKSVTEENLLNDNIRTREITKRKQPYTEVDKILREIDPGYPIKSKLNSTAKEKYRVVIEKHGTLDKDLYYLENEFPNKYSNIVLNESLIEKTKNMMKRIHTLKTIIKFFNKNENELKYHFCNIAAEVGRLDLLKWARKQVPPLKWGYETCQAAAKGGHLHILQWLRNKDNNNEVLDQDRERNKDFCNWNAYTCAAAAENGHLELLVWCRNREIHGDYICPWASYYKNTIVNACSSAAKGGHLNILRWLRNRTDDDDILDSARENLIEFMCPFEPNVFSNAAQRGHLDILEWAYTQNYNWTANQIRQVLFNFDNACVEAAKAGHLNVLRWLRNRNEQDQILDHNRERNGRLYPWGSTLSAAARSGHLHILQWCLNNSIHAVIPDNTNDICNSAAFGGHLHIIEWARTNNYEWSAQACSNAASKGHFDILKWLRTQNPPCPWDVETCIGAARSGNLEMLQWAYQRGCSLGNPYNNSCTAAAEGGHLHILKWLRNRTEDDQILDPDRENNTGICPWGIKNCYYAIKGGNFELLKWIKANGCPWERNNNVYISFNSCAEAARMGRLDILQWCRNPEIHGDDICPMYELTCDNAAKGGYLEILKWAKENGCPWMETTCIQAVINGHLDILQWVLNKTNNGEVLNPDREVELNDAYEGFGICPHDNMILIAVVSEQFETLQWLIKNNYQYNLHDIRDYLENNRNRFSNTDIKLFMQSLPQQHQQHVGGNTSSRKKNNHLFENITLFAIILLTSILSPK